MIDNRTEGELITPELDWMRGAVKMICLVCKKPMMVRGGPYGDFYYCRIGNHGTISVAKYNAIMNSLPKDRLSMEDKDPLMHTVERTQAALGYVAMTDLERFFIDSPAYDENDFWQDIRPHG